MKPEFNSLRLYGITRSLGKMFEFDVPLSHHVKIPPADEPEALLMLTVGTLADASALINDFIPIDSRTQENLEFAAKYFDAFLGSKIHEEIDSEILLLASAAYYLARRPGSSVVMARKFSRSGNESPTECLLQWILQAQFQTYPTITPEPLGGLLTNIGKALAFHFYDGSSTSKLIALLEDFRTLAYRSASPRDLLLAEVLVAVAQLRLNSSAWKLLPSFTSLAIDNWRPSLLRGSFPKELWPSQKRLGEAGIFAGESGIIQMPTSAGKTRSVEIIIKSSFLSERSRVAVVVAPFNALCNEIGASLRKVFLPDGIKINQLSDALQLDFLTQIAEILGAPDTQSKFVFVLTPEKLLYILRQAPELLNEIGLIVYDEGHQFDDATRGVTYELLVTEIKGLIPDKAQTVLISAVISNAKSVADWLIGPSAKIIDGLGLLPTARSIAFASWTDTLGQLMFFESKDYKEIDYLVPRTIESVDLGKLGTKERLRRFPQKGKDEHKDVALYLGIKLIPNGSVAIFCGKKETASKLAVRAVEIYSHGYAESPPSSFSNKNELEKLRSLVAEHYGCNSPFADAARLGIFVHHGNTHKGIRLAIEHAMQANLIRFVICTSTLAQGVNLPIRYLIVLSTKQSQHDIKTRDFQNLIGRAGRSGIHTEGLVIFSDPKIYDLKDEENSNFRVATNLLLPENSEATSSSLLSIVAPIKSPSRYHASLDLPVEVFALLLYADNESLDEWAVHVSSMNRGFNRKENRDSLVANIRARRKLVRALESFLMANRGTETYAMFVTQVSKLATSTLAFSLASDDEKRKLVTLFVLVAEHIQAENPSTESQSIYAKTLLDVRTAKKIEAWTEENRDALLFDGATSGDLLKVVWPILKDTCENKFMNSTLPEGLPLEMASLWMMGVSFEKIIFFAKEVAGGTKPHGDRRHKLSSDDILKFCEGTLDFNCGLIIAAISQFLDMEQSKDSGKFFSFFQKSLKYGLPDNLAISVYENGYADRVIAQAVGIRLRDAGYVEEFFGPALKSHNETLTEVLAKFPGYFSTVHKGTK
jgi:POLQ-like helicase